MNFQSAFNKKCSCGRVFAQAGAFKNHQNTCQKSKKLLSLALAKARGVLSSKKRHATAANLCIDHESQETIPEVHCHVQVRRLPAMEQPG
jgi:hypothetical protein